MQNLDAAQDPIVWLEYAAEDIRVVRKCLAGDDYTLRSAIYHAQQAAEKSLKAFLVLHKQPVPRVHALMLLLEKCIEIHYEFTSWQYAVEELGAFAAEIRYPANARVIERLDVEECFEHARNIYNFTRLFVKPRQGRLVPDEQGKLF